MAADADLLPLFDAGGNFYGQRLGLARRALDADLHLAPGDGRGKGDLQLVEHVGAPAGRAAARRFASPARRRGGTGRTGRRSRRRLLSKALAEELAQVDVLGGEAARAGGMPPALGRPVPGWAPCGCGPPAPPMVSKELP